jgi:hypothetical protein
VFMSALQLRQEVEKICNFGWNIKNVSSYLDVKEGTLNDVLHRKKRTQVKGSKSKTIRITYFRIFLEKISESGAFPTLDLVNSIPVMGERTFSTFIKEFYANEERLVLHIIYESVEKFKSNRLAIDFIKNFKEKFDGVVNESTLTKAAMDNPQFLADFITQGKIKNFTKALAVSKLGLAVNDNFLGLIKSLTRDTSPLVREGAYKALSEYFLADEEKYADLFQYFKDALEIETGEGVKKQIASLLSVMEMYK